VEETTGSTDDAEHGDDETEPAHDRGQDVATDDEQREGADEDGSAEHRRHAMFVLRM